MENEEMTQLEAQQRVMKNMKGDIVKLTGLLEQILRSRPREGTSTQPVVTAQPRPKQAAPFTFIPKSLEASSTSLEAQFTTSFYFLSQHQL